MKPPPQGHVMDNPHHKEDIKPDAMLVNNATSPSQYQDGDDMSYSKKEALKQLPEASSWPKPSGKGEYDTRVDLPSIVGNFLHIKQTSSRIKFKLMSRKNQANIENTSHSGLTPNPVTSTNIFFPVPSTEIPHHQILPQLAESW
ncbi:hypothetical protein O181_069939 [Austropuccinia psidii MF-1]|uniref:Uncharacterized protein n=1 Tax=Austropuccinia psidii MF-1 TaxID=1389203 RepID=A0A9Q3F095_9BASI|nr:hypothetical protein [Austropuccinia psidii MF-1]